MYGSGDVACFALLHGVGVGVGWILKREDRRKMRDG